MLSFSQNPVQGSSLITDLPYTPLIIHNNLPRQVSPKRSQKLIVKAHTNSVFHTSRSNPKSKPTPNYEIQKQWNVEGNIKIFDPSINKHALANQQRRRSRIKDNQPEENFSREKVKTGMSWAQPMLAQKQIKSKALAIQANKANELKQLKQLIEREKQEQVKNDKEFQQRLKIVEQERKELLELQRKINANGVKKTAAVVDIKKEKPVLQSHAHTNTHTQAHTRKNQQIGKQSAPRSPQNYTSSKQIPQHIAAEPDTTLNTALHNRQAQIRILTSQRSKPTLPSYSPTLIPLLSRASYKLISLHISTLVELFIDELLQEQVKLLQAIQVEQHKQNCIKKRKEKLEEYYEDLQLFVQQTAEIQGRLGRYQCMDFGMDYRQQIDKIINNGKEKDDYKKDIMKDKNIQTIVLTKVQLEIDEEMVENVMVQRDRYVRFVGGFDEYRKGNLTMFVQTTEQLIDEAIERLVGELQRGSGDFIDMIFRAELK